MSDTLLRVQAFSFTSIELENQNGKVHRHLLEVWTSELFPQSHKEETQLQRLVFDKTQLAHIREQLLAIELPSTTDQEAPVAQ